MSRSLSSESAPTGGRVWLQAVLLVVVAVAVLQPGLDAGFIWDDTQQIADSGTIAEPDMPLRYFSLNVVESSGSSGRGGDGVDTYRPLFFVALWLVYRINGADPFWYHVAVLTVHLGVCLLLWVLARRWVASQIAAAAVFMAFALHPVTAEAFLWASGIPEPLSAAGLLGAALILDRWCRACGNHWFAAAAGVVMLAGLLAKETVVTALPALSLYLWRVRGVRPRSLAGPWLAVVAYTALRVHALDGLQATGSGPDQRFAAIKNLPVLVLDGLRALVTLQPVGIRHLYWDYRGVTWSASAAAAVGVLVLAVLAWYARRRVPLVPTALAVTICMLIPVSLITTAPGWGGFGRYLYLPWGFGLLAAAEAGRRLQPVLRDTAPRLRSTPGVVAVIFIILELVGLHHAVTVYHSQENLARAAVELQPHAPEGWEWLGNHYLELGDLPAAARCYGEAVAIEPGFLRSRHNLAAALLLLGRPAEALAHETVVAADHGVTADGARVAASAAMELGRWEEAGLWLERGLAAEPGDERLLELRARWLHEAPSPEG